MLDERLVVGSVEILGEWWSLSMAFLACGRGFGGQDCLGSQPQTSGGRAYLGPQPQTPGDRLLWDLSPKCLGDRLLWDLSPKLMSIRV